MGKIVPFRRTHQWVQSYKGTKPAMKKGRALAPPKLRYLSQWCKFVFVV
jgi:hypothetical protein